MIKEPTWRLMHDYDSTKRDYQQLSNYTESEKFNEESGYGQALVVEQLIAMASYMDVLKRRVTSSITKEELDAHEEESVIVQLIASRSYEAGYNQGLDDGDQNEDCSDI